MLIQLIVFDIDGTLTTGAITYGDSGESKTFDIKDGLILHALAKLGVTVVFLTGRISAAVSRRAADVGAEAIQGIGDKRSELEALFSERGISPEYAAYIGDDLNDYAAMKLCGFKACPSDAAIEIKAICDYVSPLPGGHGAVRDICEYLLHKIGRYGELLSLYGIK